MAPRPRSCAICMPAVRVTDRPELERFESDRRGWLVCSGLFAVGGRLHAGGAVMPTDVSTKHVGRCLLYRCHPPGARSRDEIAVVGVGPGQRSRKRNHQRDRPTARHRDRWFRTRIAGHSTILNRSCTMLLLPNRACCDDRWNPPCTSRSEWCTGAERSWSSRVRTRPPSPTRPAGGVSALSTSSSALRTPRMPVTVAATAGACSRSRCVVVARSFVVG